MREPSPPARFFVNLPTLPESQDRLLLEKVAPIVGAIAEDPHLVATSFARSGTPEPLIRLVVRGDPSWIGESVTPLVEESLLPLPRASSFWERDLHDFGQEIRRWGGEEGMALAERMFHHDSVACLERLELEARGLVSRSRREWSLLVTEGLLDLCRFGRQERLGFYRRGCTWPIEEGLWSQEDLGVLESKYRKIRPALAALLGGRSGPDQAFLWGGAEAAEVAECCLARIAPIVAEWIESRDAGRLTADFGYLVWSLAHVHALRLGIDPIPEAVLRFFLCRLVEEEEIR